MSEENKTENKINVTKPAEKEKRREPTFNEVYKIALSNKYEMINLFLMCFDRLYHKKFKEGSKADAKMEKFIKVTTEMSEAYHRYREYASGIAKLNLDVLYSEHSFQMRQFIQLAQQECSIFPEPEKPVSINFDESSFDNKWGDEDKGDDVV
jgi:hypothetical protein